MCNRTPSTRAQTELWSSGAFFDNFCGVRCAGMWKEAYYSDAPAPGITRWFENFGSGEDDEETGRDGTGSTSSSHLARGGGITFEINDDHSVRDIELIVQKLSTSAISTYLVFVVIRVCCMLILRSTTTVLISANRGTTPVLPLFYEQTCLFAAELLIRSTW